MIRKLLVVAAAIAMPVSIIAVSGGMAGASNPHTVGTDTITCSKRDRHSVLLARTDPQGLYVGCDDHDRQGHGLGLHGQGLHEADCDRWCGERHDQEHQGQGRHVRWTDCGQHHRLGHLDHEVDPNSGWPQSVLNIKSIAGGTKSSHGTFTIPGKVKGTATGSFLGSNKGGSDKTSAQTTETVTALATACASKTGLKSLAIETEPGATPISLG